MMMPGAVSPRRGTRARPDLQRRLHGAEPVRPGLPARRRPVHQRRHGHHDPARRRQHDRGGGPAHGRDGRPPRRDRGDPAGHPDRGRRRGHRLGQAAPPGARHGDHARPDRHRRRRDPPAAQARARRGRSWSTPTAGRSAWSPRRTARASTGSPSSRHVMSTELLTVPAEADPRARLRPALDGPAPARAGGRRRGAAGRRADPAGRAARHPLPPGAGRQGSAADRRGDRHQR